LHWNRIRVRHGRGVSREFEQHCCEPANDNAHAGALAGQDGLFPQQSERSSPKQLGFFTFG